MIHHDPEVVTDTSGVQAPSAISARSIVKRYGMDGEELEVLKGVTFDLAVGKIAAVIGESGSGKSTLLHILGMIDRPTSGFLMINDMIVTGKSDDDLAVLRNREVGFIFQFHHLLPEFDALENVLMPALIDGRGIAESRDRAAYLLERVGLADRITHRPNELSGGELQRVAVARSLMNNPGIVLADEPSGNLDRRNSEMLHDLMWGLAREEGGTFVIVTHDLHLARRADRVFLLEDGGVTPVDPSSVVEHFL